MAGLEGVSERVPLQIWHGAPRWLNPALTTRQYKQLSGTAYTCQSPCCLSIRVGLVQKSNQLRCTVLVVLRVKTILLALWPY